MNKDNFKKTFGLLGVLLIAFTIFGLSDGFRDKMVIVVGFASIVFLFFTGNIFFERTSLDNKILKFIGGGLAIVLIGLIIYFSLIDYNQLLIYIISGIIFFKGLFLLVISNIKDK